MTGRVETADGKVYELPALLECGCGAPAACRATAFG